MVDLISPVIGVVRGMFNIKDTIRSQNVDNISVHVISNNELFEADGVEVHDYVISDRLRRAIIPKHYAKLGPKRAIFINETDLDTTKYPLKELYSLVRDRFIPEPSVSLAPLLFQFALAFFAFSFIGAFATIIGWTVITVLVITYMLFRIVVKGVKYAR